MNFSYPCTLQVLRVLDDAGLFALSDTTKLETRITSEMCQLRSMNCATVPLRGSCPQGTEDCREAYQTLMRVKQA